MGMYTELIFGAKLNKDTPEDVINTLRCMIGDLTEEEVGELSYDFNRNPLRGASYYFGVTNSVRDMRFDDIDKQWQVSTRGNIKNYGNEIEDFLEWIKPYISQGSGAKDMYAIVMYEESDEPTIYYLRD